MVAWGRPFVVGSSASLPFLGSRWSSGTMRGDRMPLPLQRNPIHSSISIFFCISKWSLFYFETFSSVLPDLSGCTIYTSFLWIEKGLLPSLHGPAKPLWREYWEIQLHKAACFPLGHHRGDFSPSIKSIFQTANSSAPEKFPKKLDQVFMFSTVIQQKLLSIISHQNIILEIKMKIVFKTRRN